MKATKTMTMTKYGKLHGVTKAAVTKWRKKGWLSFADDGKVNVEESNAKLKRYRSAPINDNQPPLPGSTALLSSDDFEKLNDLPKAELDRLLTAQKVAIAEYEKRQAKWEADIQEGRLIEVEKINQINSTRCIGLRNKLMAIPSEQALHLINCSNPAHMAQMLRNIITEALKDFLMEYGIEKPTN